ncbi:hypothetical protein Bhyg_13473 [Pseudolycoriella hygida]|uniref:Uncharacterized protein n=1 Tax=Pseudolycoriella hygida TaxID=35572 RepID=A0A9Q0MMW8_9DIPT|nr:hypothetical protein Bhyg_13473 [Pseudolycoriella hygida]
MEQFSHDLTLALEETSKCSGVSRWSTRRRTRSTGNLPCAPQPTEDSSSPADVYNNVDGSVNPTFSDSDDRQEHKLSLKSRQAHVFGNMESDSLNENFSPARPNTRRKRKFKRMAVEYETTPSTPGVGPSNPIFPIVGAVKKRVFKHTSQENFKANLFFCGKRKRSHRDRYFEQHSSSVPRQRDLFAPKNSYSEYRSRNRSFSKPCEKILPLNKTIVSKIEKISQDTKNKISGFQFLCLQDRDVNKPTMKDSNNLFKSHASSQQPHLADGDKSTFKMAQKSDSFESTFIPPDAQKTVEINTKANEHHTKKHYKSNKRIQMNLQLQFEDPSLMDCGLNEFLSSSSLSSSSDSEAAETNESDREGDDELTDWPGNEAMVNFTSKNDFKRAKPRPKTILLQKPDELATQEDDDTLMSTDELSVIPPTTLNLSVKYTPAASLNDVDVSSMTSLPIDITGGAVSGPLRNQIESEMSGETSNYFLSSGNRVEVREIRAGCRRIRNERRGFTILTSANEEFSRFLQDARQERLTLPYTDAQEHEKLFHLAKLYSLIINIENGCAILTKTSNTTQSVKIDQTTITKRFLSDYKRRCYGGDYDDHESSGMAS